MTDLDKCSKFLGVAVPEPPTSESYSLSLDIRGQDLYATTEGKRQFWFDVMKKTWLPKNYDPAFPYRTPR